jgi:hypothetical protein
VTVADITCTVRYSVPVYVEIEHGEIRRVIVDDESAELAEAVSSEVERILTTQMWPGWDFGW